MARGGEHRIRRMAPSSATAAPRTAAPAVAPARGAGALLGLQRSVGNRTTSALVVQAKKDYQVGAADDRLEVEADQVAAQVMQRLAATPGGEAERDGPQRKVAQRKLAQRNMAQRKVAQRRVAPAVGLEGGPLDESTEKAIDQKKGTGRPLDDQLRGDMEKSFGVDFSDVRVHDDTSSDGLNRNMSAKAFTTGSDIFFRKGDYQPSNPGGQQLLAHELTHVVQQGAAQRKPDLEV